jgi:peptide deformylase
VTLRKIARLGEPILRKRARPISPEQIQSPELEALIDDMIETMRDADGAGLAAPQIHESVQLCVIEVGENPRYSGVTAIPLTILINPKLTPLAANPDALADRDAISVYEGCLSVPGLRGQVRRPRRVRVEALNRNGDPIDEVWEGFSAAVVQHETDHLNGVLFVDRADPKTLTFQQEYERHVGVERRVLDGGQ